MSNFSLVEGNDHDQEPNSKTSEQTARVEIADILSSSLEPATKDKDHGTEHNGLPASKPVSYCTGESPADKGSARKDRYHSASVDYR